jgi:hypothetical protein
VLLLGRRAIADVNMDATACDMELMHLPVRTAYQTLKGLVHAT